MNSSGMCAQSDKLYETNKWKEDYEVLKSYADTEDSELLWRLIRSHYRVGKYLTKNKQIKDEIARIGEEIVERATRMHPNNFFIRKWSGVFISWSSELAGTKNKIQQSFVVKEHFQKAIELNGRDATVKHLLGRWCYEVASVSWFTRKLATTIFAEPPVSNYNEALEYFMAAEEANPNWYTGNWLFLGKTHYQLSNKEEAKKWLTTLLEATPTNPEDEEYQVEARALIGKI